MNVAIIGGSDADNVKVLNIMLQGRKYTRFYAYSSEEKKFKDKQNNYHSLCDLLHDSLVIYNNNGGLMPKNISWFYLAPTYREIPECFRAKLTYLVIFKIDKANLRQLYEEQIWGGPDYKTFVELCESRWPHGFYSRSINSYDTDKGVTKNELPTKTS